MRLIGILISEGDEFFAIGTYKYGVVVMSNMNYRMMMFNKWNEYAQCEYNRIMCSSVDIDTDNQTEFDRRLSDGIRVNGHIIRYLNMDTLRFDYKNEVPGIGMIFTDPPYGIKYKSNRRSDSEVISHDLFPDSMGLHYHISNDIVPLMERGSPVIVFGSHNTLPILVSVFYDKLISRNILYWDKHGKSAGDLYHSFKSDFELIYYGTYGRRNAINIKNRISSRIPNELTSISYKNMGELDLLPMQNQKSILGIKYILDSFDTSSMGDKFLVDPFAGAASILIAANMHGISAIGLEIDRKNYRAGRENIKRYIEKYGDMDETD